ncbi:PucR family transcriptional regulator [Salsuginibacillus kocurii]|uniref:PucR family transcriptional regulator n=1 Tax=Salsuginibacillus kocurii TaxID=427078 RepID=UPI000366B979|nr:helix-turn-helix domain-containing protein [Salsuginibacillus kocurii]
MDHSLYELYSDSMVFDPNAVEDWQRYEWFENERKELFGIEKTTLNAREKKLLLTFLQAVAPSNLFQTDYEKSWYNRCFAVENAPLSVAHYRFFHFSLTHAAEEQRELHQTLRSLFPNSGAVVWKNRTTGSIIAEDKEAEEIDKDGLELFSHALRTDFLTDVYLLAGPLHNANQSAAEAFQEEHHLFEKARQLQPKTSLFTYQDAHLHALLSQVPSREREAFVEAFLNDADRELQLTVKTYLNCHMNRTLAAKELHVHRNTLQYRLDKFSEQTGLNLHSFSHLAGLHTAFLIKKL